MIPVPQVYLDGAASRERGEPARFDLVHQCRDCRRDFYCPDRYIADSCTAMEYTLAKGWDWSWTCGGCMFKGDESAQAINEVYTRAHAVGPLLKPGEKGR